MAKRKPCRRKDGRFTKCRKPQAKRKATKRRSAAKRTVNIVYFDGTHCRDNEGAFVPVARCRGKRKPKRSS